MNRLYPAVLLLTALLTTGCNDDNTTEETFLKPIAEHITGKWEMKTNSVFENGKWVEQTNDDNVAMAMEFRPDGTEVRIMTFPDGFTFLATRTWRVDEANKTLNDGAEQRLIMLAKNELVTEASLSQNPGTGEISEKLCRWTYRRVSEQDKTMAEQLVGRWTIVAAYDWKDGDWVESQFGLPDESRMEFGENGIWRMYSRKGSMESSSEDMKWSVNSAEGLLRNESDGQSKTRNIEMLDTDHVAIEILDKIYKEVYVRENK